MMMIMMVVMVIGVIRMPMDGNDKSEAETETRVKGRLRDVLAQLQLHHGQ